MRRCPRAVLGRALASMVPIGLLGLWAVVGGGGAAGSPAAAAGTTVRPTLALTSVDHDTINSTNWSGYVVQSATAFTDVVGSWVEPTGTCSLLHPTYSAFWVGIDGFQSASVEQLGTSVDCSWTGTPSYDAWWEMYPANSVSLSASAYPVNPGDTMTAQVKRSGGTYTLSLHSSRGWTFVTTQSGTDADASAEWVAEAPEVCTAVFCRGASLTDFGSVAFTGALATSGGTPMPISAFTAGGGPHQITMVSTVGAPRAVPGPLAAGGSSFVDTWKSS